MKKYTQAEFDAILKNEHGIKLCPSGDYTSLKSFGNWCSFGERCSFGEGCKYCDFVFSSIFCLYGIFKYTIIIYKNKKKYKLSIGCENFNTLDSAVEKAKSLDIYDENTHKVLGILLNEEIK